MDHLTIILFLALIHFLLIFFFQYMTRQFVELKKIKELTVRLYDLKKQKQNLKGEE